MPPTQLLEHDNALRAVTAATRAAKAAGASDRSILERVIAGLRGLELLGPAERELADLIAPLLAEAGR